MKLSILIPVYNESASVEALLRRVVAAPLDGVEREMVVVDDCSTDGTRAILARLAQELPNLRIIHHPQNRGKGAGIRTALAAATGDYVIIQDADLEYEPEDYRRLLEPIRQGKAKVVYGARPLDGSGGRWVMDLGNRGLSVITNLLYGTRLHDMETCYKVIPADVLRSFPIECSRFDMEPEITAKLVKRGYHIHDVPIRYNPRAGGKKLSAWRDGLPTLWALIKYRFVG